VLTFDNDDDLAYIVENDSILGALYKQINEEQNITVNYDSRVNQCNLSDSHRDLATVKVANGDTSFETSLLVGENIYYEFDLKTYCNKSKINFSSFLDWLRWIWF